MKTRPMLAILFAVASSVVCAQAPPIPEEIKALDWLLGDWRGNMTMDMGGKPTVGKAAIKFDRHLDGRFLRGISTFQEPTLGTTSAEFLVTFNPATKAFVGWWFDSMSVETLEFTGDSTASSLAMVSKPIKVGQEENTFRTTYTRLGAKKLGIKVEVQKGNDWTTFLHGDFDKK